jgi:hypothetical protein
MKKSLLVLFSVLVAGGVAWYDSYSRHSEAALMERANTYWEAIRSNDLVTAYQLETETAMGTLAPHEVELRRDWGVRVVGYRLDPGVIDGDKAEIPIVLEVTLPDSETKTKKKSGKKDFWTYIKGQWYHGIPQPGTSLMRGHAPPPPDAAPWNPFNPNR